VKLTDPAGNDLLTAYIDEVDDLTVGRIEERYPAAMPVPRTVGSAPRIAFGLLQDIGRSDFYFRGFDDAEELPFHKEGIVGRSAFGRVFFDGVAIKRRDD
jgi:hypothetical protein